MWSCSCGGVAEGTVHARGHPPHGVASAGPLLTPLPAVTCCTHFCYLEASQPATVTCPRFVANCLCIALVSIRKVTTDASLHAGYVWLKWLFQGASLPVKLAVQALAAAALFALVERGAGEFHNFPQL